MKFLRELLAAILGVLIAMGIMFLIFMIIISASASSLEEEKTTSVESNSVLELNLENRIKDYAPKNTDPLVGILGVEDGALGLQEILNAIENAKSDDDIKGISIKILIY